MMLLETLIFAQNDSEGAHDVTMSIFVLHNIITKIKKPSKRCHCVLEVGYRYIYIHVADRSPVITFLVVL